MWQLETRQLTLPQIDVTLASLAKSSQLPPPIIIPDVDDDFGTEQLQPVEVNGPAGLDGVGTRARGGLSYDSQMDSQTRSMSGHDVSNQQNHFEDYAHLRQLYTDAAGASRTNLSDYSELSQVLPLRTTAASTSTEPANAGTAPAFKLFRRSVSDDPTFTRLVSGGRKGDGAADTAISLPARLRTPFYGGAASALELSMDEDPPSTTTAAQREVSSAEPVRASISSSIRAPMSNEYITAVLHGHVNAPAHLQTAGGAAAAGSGGDRVSTSTSVSSLYS